MIWRRVWAVLRDETGNLNFGGSSQQARQQGTQQVLLQPAAPGQEELTALNIQLAKQQLAQLQAAAAEQTAFAGSPQAKQEEQLRQLAMKNLIARLTGEAPVLSPEEQARLDTVYGTTQRQGEQDLLRFADEIGASRGMTRSDTPIAGELLRQRTRFGETLASQKAASSLDLGNTQANFNAAIMQFQNQLQQQALMNRLAIAGTTPASYGLQSQLFGQQMASSPIMRRGSGSQSGFNWGAGLSGQDVQGYGLGAKALGFGA